MQEQEFLELISDALEVELSDLSFQSKLEEVDEWDSIGQLAFIGLLDESLAIDIDVEKMLECATISQLFEFVISSVEG